MDVMVRVYVLHKAEAGKRHLQRERAFHGQLVSESRPFELRS